MSTDERMERIEGQLARVRWVNRSLIACIIVLSLGVWAKFGAKEVRAVRFVVEDENGNTRIGLVVLKGGPTLGLNDENGNTRALLSVEKDGGLMKVLDKNKEPIWSAP